MHTCKELDEFANSLSRSLGNVWEWILRVWDNGRRNINLGQVQWLGIGTLIGDCI